MAKSKKNTPSEKRRKFIVDRKPDQPYEMKTHGYNFVNSKFTKLLIVIIILSMTVGIVITALIELFK